MAKLATVLGLMSGTSMDGIDLALLRTDGQNVTEFISSAFTPYPAEIRATLRAVLGRNADSDGQVARASALVTNQHIAASVAFLAKTGIKPDLVGFHGQTIFHNPAAHRTWQIGDGQALANALNTPVVYDFRSNDMRHGGQGAPLLPLYHAALLRAAKLPEPACVLNLGGVGNMTWMLGEQPVACDSGPANALIDDWMLEKTGQPMDEGGQAALAGTPDQTRINRWLELAYFALPAPKSLDRNAFAACTVAGLSVQDGAATLAAFTTQSVLATLKLMPAMPRTLVVAGGGRHNAAIMKMLNASIEARNADTLGWRGDSLEAEGFAYLAKRSVDGLPLSLPGTTGCASPVTGGVLVHPEKI